MARSSMPSGVASRSPRSGLEAGSGSLQGDRDPEATTDEETVSRLRDALYGLTRGAVDVWGGPMALASYWRCAFSNISARLNRKEVNGSTQQAFLDFLAIAVSDARAAGLATAEWIRSVGAHALTSEAGRGEMESAMRWLCDALGYEPPKKRRTKTTDEKFAALVKGLREAGPLGEAAIRAAAAEIGADPSEYGL